MNTSHLLNVLKPLRQLATMALCCALPISAIATPSTLQAWKDRYGSVSPIDDNNVTECQICHVSAGGGSAGGWNGYGWRIREILNASVSRPTIDEALIRAGVNDADQDPAAAFSITEIMNGHHPGWRETNNTHYFQNGHITTNHNPPREVANHVDLDPATPLDNPISSRIHQGDVTVSLQTISEGFISPLLAVPAPGVDNALFVVDQVGIVWRVSLQNGDKTRFFDVSKGSNRPEGLSSRLVDVGNAGVGAFDERGLLGLAFHPNFQSNGKFYTYQSEPVNGTADFTTLPMGGTADHQTVVAEWTASDPNADVSSVTKRTVLRIDQPQFNHNGGMLAFDENGLLYIALGDGGAGDDQDLTTEEPGNTTRDRVLGHGASGNGSNPANPFGAILRIDPDGRNSANGQYGLPSSNPFDGTGQELAEIYAYGLRNPYRFSFDMATGDLYAGDVGQGDVEEINLIESGQNYGWNQKEGRFWFYPNFRQNGYVSNQAPTPLPTGLTDPILQYDHDDGISVTAGYVYRGNALPELDGTYLFGDWSTDFGQPQGRLFYSDDQASIREFRLAGQSNVGLFITGFGQDTQGEVYVVGNTRGVPLGTTGVLQKIVPAVPEEPLCLPIKNTQGRFSVVCL